MHASVAPGQQLATKKQAKPAAAPAAEVKMDKAEGAGVKAEAKAIKAEQKPAAKGLKENIKKAVESSGSGAKKAVAKPVVKAKAAAKGVQQMASATAKEQGKDTGKKDPRLEYSHKQDHRLGFIKFSWCAFLSAIPLPPLAISSYAVLAPNTSQFWGRATD